MKINKTFKIEQIVSKAAGHEAIHNVKIEKDGDKAIAVATNGRRLVVVPVTVENESELGLCPPKAFKLARKATKAKFTDSTIALNSDVKIESKTGAVSLTRPVEGKEEGQVPPFPNWRQVLPNGNVKFSIALNARFLLEMAEAMGAVNDQVTLSFEDEFTGIRVKANGNPLAFGVLMPVRMS